MDTNIRSLRQLIKVHKVSKNSLRDLVCQLFVSIEVLIQSTRLPVLVELLRIETGEVLATRPGPGLATWYLMCFCRIGELFVMLFK